MEGPQEHMVVDVREHGFEGELRIEQRDGTPHVVVSGSRPVDGADVVKDVPVDRDAGVAQLVDDWGRGDEAAPRRLLAHLGVLDPPLPD